MLTLNNGVAPKPTFEMRPLKVGILLSNKTKEKQ